MLVIHKLLNPILWTKTSEAIYKILKKFIRKDYRIIELGSGTGHLSYLLAKKGYNLTLNEIRKDELINSKKIFIKNNIKANFISKDLYEIHRKYDFVFNTGLIQCFNDKNKEKFIKKLSKLSNRVLLFYPDTEDKRKILGKNNKQIPGVDDAKEYPVSKIPELIYRYFDTIQQGELDEKEIGLKFKMFWIYAELQR